MRFSFHGHSNVLSTHRTTLEFTKDDHLTKRGDCIVGVRADYELEQIRPLLSKDRLLMTIEVEDMADRVEFVPNPDFNDREEMVVRTSDYISKRTLGIHASKASVDLDRKMIAKIQKGATGTVTIE